MTLRQAVAVARQQLAASSPELEPTAARDAELLLLHALALPRTTLRTYPSRLLNEREQATFFAAVGRRQRHEPVQYITGTQEFFGLPFAVSPAVLIPRPETELLVEAALQRLPADRDLHLLDIGTGSGAIAVVLASQLRRARVTAIDQSPAALAIARENASRHGVLDRIDFLESDLLAALPESTLPVDAILSNPPYIPEPDRPSLHPEVRDHEPPTALFAGAEGLDIYRRLIPQAARHLRAAGLLALELGAGQRSALERLLRGWHAVQFLPDLQGIPRVALARKP